MPTEREEALLATWERIRAAHDRAASLHARILERTQIDVGEAEPVPGFVVEVGGVKGLLHAYGTPWQTEREPQEADVWVLKYDMDLGVLHFLAFSPATGPAR